VKIACSTTVFSTRSLEEALSGIAARGYKYVDLLMMENWAHINPSSLVDDLDACSDHILELLKENSLEPVALNTHGSADLASSDMADIKQNRREGMALVDFAERIGAPVLVAQPGSAANSAGFESAMAASVAVLTDIAEYSHSRGIVLAIEAHSGSLAEKYNDALRMVATVPHLKIAYDPSHCIMMDLDMTDSLALLEYTAHIHLRNAVSGNFQAPMSDGILDFKWILDSIDSAVYRGAISIEYLDNRGEEILDDVDGLKRLLDSRYPV
jgi:sugar phosphate isomerase/epimerase